MLRRLCKQYPGALPSAILAEDGGLLMQLLRVDAIVTDVEAKAAASAAFGVATWDYDDMIADDAEGVFSG